MMRNFLRILIASLVLFIIFFVIAYNIIELPDTSLFSDGIGIPVANRTIAAIGVSAAIIFIIVFITGIFIFIDNIKKDKLSKKYIKGFILFFVLILVFIALSFTLFFVNINKVLI